MTWKSSRNRTIPLKHRGWFWLNGPCGLASGLLWMFLLFSAAGAFGQSVLVDVGEEIPEPSWLVLPYAFPSETLDFAFGVAGGMSGYVQEQAQAFGALLGSSNASFAVFLLAEDVQLPLVKRLFLDAKFSVGWYTAQRAYIDGNPEFPYERAGSNRSDKDDFIWGEGWDNWFEIQFKYVLPLGHARKSVISRYTLDRGLLVAGASGGESWNPLRSGRTLLSAMYFFRYRTFDEDAGELSLRTNGIAANMERDNRDFIPNPSRGSYQRLGVSRDFGWFDSTDSWTFVDFEVSKYFSLGPPKYFRQCVVALNLWTGDSPTWTEQFTAEGWEISHRPPNYMGAALGGFDRMRAFPSYRFNDRAVIYYCAELRVIPEWNPLGEWKWLRALEIDWWQVVPFVEIGRVAPVWSISELHTRMKWDAGIGLRFMAKKSVIRVDTGFSEEGYNLWVMAGQPF